MCGIAGIIAAVGDTRRALERLTEALHHRGPDGCGFHYTDDRRVGLGHRRLSIIDIAGGAQPLSNEDGRIWVTYNGEIYNHLALRRELTGLGHGFRTNADTEVLVHGFEAWGPALFERLNGIFAFGLYDGRAHPGELWLVRDPVGAKPLYLGRARQGWWFASELAAARETGLVESDLRPAALDEFLVYRFIPSPGTPYRSAWKIPPGHYCRLSVTKLPTEPQFVRYEPRFAPAVVPRTEGEWTEALRTGLERAVTRQLMSDVPVASLLSGGVDSTAITAIMRAGLAQPPQAFAVGFTGDEAGELAMAERASAALDVPLTTRAVSEREYLAAWLAQVSRLGEPIANSASLLLALVCETVGTTHKVVLTGQGADEPLGGYPRHSAERWHRYARLLGPLARVVPERAAASDRVARMRRIMREADTARRFTEILAVWSPGEAAALTRHPARETDLSGPVRRWLDPESAHDSLNALLTVDARLSLADDLLIVADHMAMRSSVELRVPFLDLELLGLIERMPSRYKVSGWGERKWLYRRAVRPLVPAGLRRPLLGWGARTGKKLGFTTPLEQWLQSWVATDSERFFVGANARLPDFVDAAALGRYLETVRRRNLPRGRQLMSLFVLESWLRGAYPA